MEKFVPLLIGLAIFGFRSYQNYMKEQEAALKRKQPSPPVPAPIHQAPPAYRAEHTKPNAGTPPPFYAEKIKETNEVQRFKQEREMHRSTLNKKVKTIDLNQEKNTLREDFDLRKAVIMSVILERPYK